MSNPGALEHVQRNLGVATANVDLSVAHPESFGNPDVIVAGPPCQGFSTLGKRDQNDPRNTLLVVPARFACALRPRFVIVENVGGARSPLNRHYLEQSSVILRNAGYKVATLDIEMRRFGVAQRRRRAIQFAWRGSGEFTLPTELRVDRPSLGLALSGVEGTLNHDPVDLSPASRTGRIAKFIAPGQKLCNVRVSAAAVRTWAIPSVFGTTTAKERLVLEAIVRLRRRDRKRDWGDADPVSARSLSGHVGFPTHRTLSALVSKNYVRVESGLYDLVHTFNGKYRRPTTSGLAPTVDTRFCDPHYVLHPTEDRPFTVREAARIQGFPDSYELRGSRRSQTRLIANAVPPPAGEAIGRAVNAFLASGNV